MSVKMYTFLHTIYVPTNIDGGLGLFHVCAKFMIEQKLLPIFQVSHTRHKENENWPAFEVPWTCWNQVLSQVGVDELLGFWNFSSNCKVFQTNIDFVTALSLILALPLVETRATARWTQKNASEESKIHLKIVFYWFIDWNTATRRRNMEIFSEH